MLPELSMTKQRSTWDLQLGGGVAEKREFLRQIANLIFVLKSIFFIYDYECLIYCLTHFIGRITMEHTENYSVQSSRTNSMRCIRRCRWR